ncbi:MAG: hypothetical protein K6U74_15200 [Firmicutes bacterium]|nr:hypothetical protein [Bacillota bacterium]
MQVEYFFVNNFPGTFQWIGRLPVDRSSADHIQRKSNLEIPPEEKPLPRLRICCLGAFMVFRGGELLGDNRWPRRKCKTMLKFLALNLGQKVPKEVIVDILWPDLPAEKASNAFYVTLPL